MDDRNENLAFARSFCTQIFGVTATERDRRGRSRGRSRDAGREHGGFGRTVLCTVARASSKKWRSNKRRGKSSSSTMVDEEIGDAAAAVACDDNPEVPEYPPRDPDASAVVPSHAVPVVGVPTYPNCIKWSEENVLAIGTGHLVTILDPASMSGPRGFIPVATSAVFNFGRVHPKDLDSHSLFEIRLARDSRPVVRSIDWSSQGLAQNGGSLLAVCTTDGRVKVYRSPFCDFQSEWVEIIDLSELVFNDCLNHDFKEAEQAAARLALEEETISPPFKWGFKLKRKPSDDVEPQHRKVQKSRHLATDEVTMGHEVAIALPASEGSLVPSTSQNEQGGVASFEALSIIIEKGSRVEVLEEDEGVQYWVGGFVADIVNGDALVKLDRPQYGAMQEWVPLYGTNDSDSEETNQPSSGNSTMQWEGKQVVKTRRPRIRPQIALDTLQNSKTDEAGDEGSLVRGELVEAWINHRWQGGVVSEVQGSGVIVDFSASSTSDAVELKALRRAPVWNGKRWVWKATSKVSSVETAVVCYNSNNASISRTVESIGRDFPSDPSEGQYVGQGDDQIQSLEGTIKTGQVTLHIEQDAVSSRVQSGPGEDSTRDMLDEAKEKPYSRVYKRRGPVTTPSLPVNSLGTEVSSARPIRSRRLPSKLRSGDIVPWMTGADGTMLSQNILAEENLPQDSDGDYLQNVQDVKHRTKGKKDAVKVKEAKTTKDTSTGKEAKSVNVGEKEKEREGKNENTCERKWTCPHDYAARSELLTPLSVAWSPKFQDQSNNDAGGGHKAKTFALLGAGMKSGKVCLWQMACPHSYSVDCPHVPVTASFLGFLSAHESWVNTLGWSSCCQFDLGKLNARDFSSDGGLSGDTLLLATGCADGSVKLWAGLSRELTSANRVNYRVPFMLLREVVEVDYVIVTALELFVPPRPGDRALLAIGKGSGSVVVWELKSSGNFRLICSDHRAHEQMVTGFSWTSDGRCLYSCAQDSMKRWDCSQDGLLPLPFPDTRSVFPSNTASDVCSLETLEAFYGITMSPNGLALAAVRGIASDLLDQMYQARSQKGMVQLFWLGNEHIDFNNGNYAILPSPDAMSGHDTDCWEQNIIDALEALQDPRKTLVVWDMIAALSLLKDKLGIGKVVSIISKWLSSWAPGRSAVGAFQSDEWLTGTFQKSIPEASCRRLQLMNILYRRGFLPRVKTDLVRLRSSEDPSNGDDMDAKLCEDGLTLVEHELRQRLVHITLKCACEGNNLKDTKEGRNSMWIQLLVEWVLSNVHSVQPELRKLAAKLQATKGNRFVNLEASVPIETCTFCDSSVSLESPEVASCSGSDKHHLQRCSVSMQVCPPVCLWHCGCCGRTAVRQGPSLFFSLSSREQITGLSLSVLNHADSYPSCPFCGILMHRLLPDFFLTPTFV